MKRLLYPLICVLALAGCNTGTMTSYQYDAKTGQQSRTVYTKYYDAGNWLIPNRLGMSAVVDHEKKVIPVLHRLQQSVGALGPGDSYANGKVSIYIWNRDRVAYQVKIVRVSSRNASFEPKGEIINGVAGLRTGGEVGDIQISNYDTQIPLKIEYEIRGTPGVLELELDRRTDVELKKYFGPGGIPPYPWFHEDKT